MARGMAADPGHRFPSAPEFGESLTLSLEVERLSANENTLFIGTVGNTPDPVVASILHARPGRLIFGSQRSYSWVEARGGILNLAAARGFYITRGRYEIVPLLNEISVNQ